MKNSKKLSKYSKIINTVAFLLFSWLSASFILFLFADNIIFKTQYSRGPIKSPLQYEEIFIPYDKKEKLYLAQSFAKKSDKLVVVFFHGNAGKVGRIVNNLAPYHNFVAPAYPGYHLSSGIPSQEAMYKTVDLTMDYLKKQNIKQENIIIFGASLGGTAALYAAKKYPDVKNVILLGTFDKIQSICTEIYHIFCIFSGPILNNIKLAKEAKATIRHFHSIDDEIVNFEYGQNLFQFIASKDKKFYQIRGGHNNFDAVKIIKQSQLE